MQNIPTVFDNTASKFAAKTDLQIEGGRYRRGDLFLNAVLSTVASGGYLLDYGCGPGRISWILAKSGFRVIGLDPSREMVAVAKRQSLEELSLDFQTISAEFDIPKGERFDGIICSSVIEYSSNPANLLKAFQSVLRPSGTLIISFANSRSIFRAPFQHRNLHLGAQRHTWTWPQFRSLLEEANFQSVGSPQYFEGPVGRVPGLSLLTASQFVGGLGLIIAKKKPHRLFGVIHYEAGDSEL
ncbi:MAG: methyltransferase domain-containing protein [Terracidiphilus sp.]